MTESKSVALPLGESPISLSVLKNGGSNRVRTYDPLLVRQMLSQLSYTPGNVIVGAGEENRTLTASLEGWSSTIELHPHLIESFCKVFFEN